MGNAFNTPTRRVRAEAHFLGLGTVTWLRTLNAIIVSDIGCQ
jgi:hypothetical protein